MLKPSLSFGRSAFVAMLAMAVAGPSFAASDGRVGATSEGRLELDLTIPPLVRISDLDDIDLGTFAGGGLSGSDNVCVWSTTRSYSVTANGGGSGGAFSLIGAANGDTLNYDVAWAESANAGSGTELTSGDSLGGRSTTSVNPTCSGGANPNATVLIDVPSSELAAVTADTYSGTLTLLVEPE